MYSVQYERPGGHGPLELEERRRKGAEGRQLARKGAEKGRRKTRMRAKVA